MSELYDAIPPERREAYLANAEAVLNEVSEPMREAAAHVLGGLVVDEAQSIADTAARGDEIVAGATNLLERHNQHVHDEVERMTSEPPTVSETLKRLREEAFKANKASFMRRRREYTGRAGAARSNLGRHGFGALARRTGQRGVGNELWLLMALQEQRNPSEED